ncbi:MAG: hypothetical protein AAGG68_23025 [Bacteroidota bacterium]
MKKTTMFLLCFLIGIIGFLLCSQMALTLGFMSQVRGYIDYCYSVKLPHTLNIILIEIVFTALISGLLLYAELFGLTRKRLKYILTIATLNLSFMAYQVIQYPILLRVLLGWGNDPDTVKPITHPLLYSSLLNAFLIILLTYRKRKLLADQLFIRVTYSTCILLTLAEVMSRVNTVYQACMG